MRRLATAAFLALAAAAAAFAGEIPDASIVLEATPGTPGGDPAGAPPRFVLMKDGQVFVGGTRHLEVGRLEGREVSALKKRVDAVRKLPGLSSAPGTASPISLGGDPARTLRLLVLDGKAFEVVATGDPAEAPPALAPLAGLLTDLLRYHHPSLRPYKPDSFVMTVREGRLAGGCRPWGFPFPITEAVAAPRAVSAEEAAGWPKGAMPASVCADESGPSTAAARRHIVTLRPLLPGERP